MIKHTRLALLVSFLCGMSSTAYAQDISEIKALSGLFPEAVLSEAHGVDNAYIQKLAELQTTSPYIRRYVDWKTQQHSLKTSKSPDANHRLPGAVTEFYVSFPFAGTTMFDFARPFTPEAGYDTSKAPEGVKYPALNWMRYESVGNNSLVRPGERVYGSDFSTVFLATRIVIDDTKPVQAWLEIPSTTPVIAWMNGERVLEFIEKGPENAPLYGEKWPVTLQPGENILTIKTAQIENAPEFYVFLTDQKTNEPIQFTMNLHSPDQVQDLPVISGVLKNDRPKDSQPSILMSIARDDTMPAVIRAAAYKLILPDEDAKTKINDLLMSNPDEIAKLPDDEFEMAVSLLEPYKSLQIIKKTDYKNDPRKLLLYARQTFLNAQEQPDTVLRIVDEWRELQNLLKSVQAPTVHGISYEPLRRKLLAIPELNMHQALTAGKFMFSDIEKCPDCMEMLGSFILTTLSSRKHIAEYREMLDTISQFEINSSAWNTEMLSQSLRKAVGSNDNNQIASVLASIQKEADRFFSIHPHDGVFWEFWLNTLGAWGVDSNRARADKSLQNAYAKAGFTADADTWYMIYLSSRINDPHRWLFYAKHCLETDQIAEAVSAYEMASKLLPEDETITERIHMIQSLNNHDTGSVDTADPFETPYIIRDIPANRDPNAVSLVSLLDNRIVRILPDGHSSTFYQIAFEILDDHGLKSIKAMPINYSPNDEKIEIISVTTTKKDGSVRHLYKTSEYNMSDESIKMYYDMRQIVIEIQDLAVGDRVEYQFKRTQIERDVNSVSFFSDLYSLQTQFNRQWSRYTVISPESMKVRMLRHTPSGDPKTIGTVKTENGVRITSYEEKDMPRFLAEDGQPGPTELMPVVIVSTFESWQALAKWFIDMALPQWKADDAIRAKVHELTDGVTDNFEKLKRIHSFVVKSTRYVALEFGIHGHKPYPAAQVFERRFGDCKDKASLMKVMLKEAGIDSRFVLARTRPNGDITMELPSPFLFDHAILYVPEFNLYLDGTAEFSGTSELPAMDQDAWTLIIDDEAGYKLQKAPVIPAKDNMTKKSFVFDLTSGDRVPYSMDATIKGFQAPAYRERYQIENLRREKLQVEMTKSVPGTEIENFEFEGITDLEHDIVLSLKASTSFTDVAKKDGNTWLVTPMLRESHLVQNFASASNRRTPIMQAAANSQEFTYTIVLPENAQVTLPPPVSEKASFGEYSVEAVKEGNRVTTRITMTIDRIRIMPDEFTSLIDFMQRFDRRMNTPYQITFE
ncbi:MAG: DUF3857 and transglutaminase domain-containing protein [Proteobacteria bacterium]|nr:DUF3857 and transglutaminase domain-containing protein [Pseudomonadota bacterium]